MKLSQVNLQLREMMKDFETAVHLELPMASDDFDKNGAH